MKKIHNFYIYLLIVSFFSQMAIAGSGILPYTIKPDGKVYILLGKQRRGYSDFGGKSDKGDKGDHKYTAAREGTEETRCVYGKGSRLKSIRYFYAKLEPSISSSHYPLYPIKVPYIRSEVFNKAKKVPHFEKTKYIWIEAGDLLRCLNGNNQVPVKYDRSKHKLYSFFVELMSSSDARNFLYKLNNHNKKVDALKKHLNKKKKSINNKKRFINKKKK